MKTSDLSVDSRIVSVLREEGIDELYPPQAEAIGPALAGDNLVLSIPTASGKSLVAYLAILNSVLRGGKALYIVPLKALASEKYEELTKFDALGLKVGESTGDFDQIDPKLSKYDIVVATSEKVDSLLRHRTKWLKQITVVVADEVHLINDPDRGPTLEVILVKFRTFNPHAQLIALSATIRNSPELAEWLDARLVESEWRPVPLREGVYLDGEVFFTDNSRAEVDGDVSPVNGIVRKTLESGGQCLVFVNTRKSTESLASELRGLARKHLGPDSSSLAEAATRLVADQEEPTTLGARLSRCIKSGCAFHHAGLTTAQRRFVESSFRDGALKVIAATPTLAAGINLPARTVVVRDVRRYDSNIGYVAIPVLEVKQMCGRAGRPRYDPFGEAILIAKSDEERSFLLDTYLLGENENLYSKLGTEPAIRSHVLGLIATRDAASYDDLVDFFGRTFLAHQTDVKYLEDGIANVLDFLRSEEMIHEGDDLSVTPFGKRVSDVYIDPMSAVIMRRALEAREELTEFGLIHAVCAVPDMTLMYLRRSDYEWVEGFLDERRGDLLLEPPTDLGKYELFLSEIKTAKLVSDWVSEVGEKAMEEAYGIGPGDIRNKADLAEWLMHAMARLSALVSREATPAIEELHRRIVYGIQPDLLELVKLRGIGRIRARALHGRGISTMEHLRQAPYDRLKQIPNIGEAVARSIKKQLGQTDEGMTPEAAAGQMSLREF
ncbi:MAG: DEAD/DEAH box helicase [Methanobacteriota archaeon]|nr:MAG: DEAD/DEAH box helicase [Euryarchaeota archaeon]